MVKALKSSSYRQILSQIKSCRANGLLCPARIQERLALQYIHPNAEDAEFFFRDTSYHIQ